MEQAASIKITPTNWLGERDSTAPTEIDDAEWVEGRNVDAHPCKRRGGEVQETLVEGATTIRAVMPYYRTDGTRHRLQYTGTGKLWDDAAEVLTGLSTTAYPIIVPGPGFAMLFTGTDRARWRDPADGVWKVMTIPTDWTPKYATFHPLSRRLYVAPTAAGVDYFGWSNPDFTHSNLSFVAAGGGGSEPMGSQRQPITGIAAGLGDDVCVFTTDQIYQIRGLDPGTWRTRYVSADVGCTAPRSVVNIGHGLFFVHYSGAYLVNALGAVTFPPLTEPMHRAWRAMVAAYGPYLQYAHATWSANEHTVYLFIPNSSSSIMGQLWKFYLPDSSISIHDVTAYCSGYESPNKVLIGKDAGVLSNLYYGDTDRGTAINGYVKTKIYGEIGKTKTWGVQQKFIVLFRPLTAGQATVTPYIYRDSTTDPIAGTAQTVSLTTTGDIVRATCYLPTDQGWGFQLKVSGVNAWEFVGFEISAMEQDIE